MDTSKGIKTKDKIIRIAARLFLQKGYHATGINEILIKSEVPKGSFYFHFQTKKELAAYVAQYYSVKLIDWFENSAQDRNWSEFISVLVGDMKVVANRGRHLGCPLGVLGVEIALVEPDIASEYVTAMDKIIAIFSEVLQRSGLTATEASNTARQAFILYQGYLQYYRMTRNDEIFDYILRDVTGIIKKLQ